MAAAWAALGSVLYWMLCIVGVLLAVLFCLVLVILFVPAFAEFKYEDDDFSVAVGMLCLRVHVYPYFYFLIDRRALETEEEREVRLAAEKAKEAAKRAAAKAKKAAKKEAEKAMGKAEKKGPKITLDVILTLVQTAGMVMRLLLGALRIRKIRIDLPIHTDDPAKTAILYGKANAGLYSGLAILNNFLHLDFEQVQITPVFEENFERSAYFSCKVSAQLFIMVVIAFRLLKILRTEKELLAFFVKRKPRSAAK